MAWCVFPHNPATPLPSRIVNGFANKIINDFPCAFPQIYGTVLIFWSFAFVQIIYQTLPPGFFWGAQRC